MPPLKHFHQEINLSKIFQAWQEVNNDLFGSIMLHEVLNTFVRELKTGIILNDSTKINIKLTRFNMTGNDSLVSKDKDFAYYNFKNMSNCTGSKFMHDQWGFSNAQKPDGMWRMDIMNVYTESIIMTIPIFLETDSGNDEKAKQKRITAMKLWQDISCGHLIPETKFVCIMRLNVEQGSLAEFDAAHDKNEFIMAHLAQLAYGSAMVIYSIIKFFIPPKHCTDPSECDLHLFVPEIEKKADLEKAKHFNPIYSKEFLYDLHFYIGQFGFERFQYNQSQMIKPVSENYNLTSKPTFTKFKRPINLPNTFPDFDWNDFKNYFDSDTYPDYVYGHDKDASNLNKSEPRFTNDFFANFKQWSSSMTYAVQSSHGFGKFTQAHCSVHCIATKRNHFEPEKIKTALAITGPQSPLTDLRALFEGMWYMQSIIQLLDLFIMESNNDDSKLCALCKSVFSIPNAITKIKVPETSSSYEALCKRGPQKGTQTRAKYFIENTGFAVFIDPMNHVMENAFYAVTSQ